MQKRGRWGSPAFLGLAADGTESVLLFDLDGAGLAGAAACAFAGASVGRGTALVTGAGGATGAVVRFSATLLSVLISTRSLEDLLVVAGLLGVTALCAAGAALPFLPPLAPPCLAMGAIMPALRGHNQFAKALLTFHASLGLPR